MILYRQIEEKSNYMVRKYKILVHFLNLAGSLEPSGHSGAARDRDFDFVHRGC